MNEDKKEAFLEELTALSKKHGFVVKPGVHEEDGYLDVRPLLPWELEGRYDDDDWVCPKGAFKKHFEPLIQEEIRQSMAYRKSAGLGENPPDCLKIPTQFLCDYTDCGLGPVPPVSVSVDGVDIPVRVPGDWHYGEYDPKEWLTLLKLVYEKSVVFRVMGDGRTLFAVSYEEPK